MATAASSHKRARVEQVTERSPWWPSFYQKAPSGELDLEVSTVYVIERGTGECQLTARTSHLPVPFLLPHYALRKEVIM